MSPSYQPLNQYHDEKRIYHHSNPQRHNIDAPHGSHNQKDPQHHDQLMKWICPVRSYYTPQCVSEYESSSPESCNGNDASVVSYYNQQPQANGQYSYMITPSPEPPTCPINAANIALSLAVQRDALQRDAPHYNGIEHSPPPYHSPSGSPTTAECLQSSHLREFSIAGFKFDVATSRDKRFICKYPGCTGHFKRQEHLRRHERSHTGVRNYKCDVEACGRRFSRSDNLKSHRKTHMKVTGRNVFVPGFK